MRRFCFEAALRRFARAGCARRGGERARDGVLGVVSITRLARLRHPRSSRTREGRRRARLASALWPPLRSDRGSGARSDFLFKMLLIGDSGVGKSCLLLRFAVRCLPPPCAPGALPAVAAAPTPPACDRRMPSTRRTSSRPSAWTLCAAPRPSPRCGARSERGVLARAPSEKSHRGDRREAGQVPAGARARHAPAPPRARTTTARAAASAGPLASARSRLPPAAACCSGTLPGRSASGRSRAATTAGARAS